MLSSWKYSSLNSLISEDAECKAEPAWTEDCDSDETSHSRSRYSYIRIVSPWIVSTAFFAVLTTYFGYHSISHPAASLPGPFETDFQAARDWVEYEERRFTGALDYDVVTGQAYRHVDLSQPQYFGEPSPEIEEAWDGLLRNEFAPMSTEEAAPFTPKLRPFPNDGKFHFELDVFHTLHCLNAIRKRLDEYYYESRNASTDSSGWEKTHMDHCLDQIRQSVQCHGDLSPVPLFWWDGFDIGLGIGQTHTCRKWEPIREWVDRRNLGLDATRAQGG